MTALFKHGSHIHSLNLPALSAGTSNDSGASICFRPWPAGSSLIGGDALAGIDRSQYQLSEATVVPFANHTGQATDFTDLALQHYSAAGVLLHDIRVQLNAAGKTLTADLPVNLAVALGAVATNAGTAVLTDPSSLGVLPWDIQFGETIIFARISEGNGKASPAMGCTIFLQEKNA